ncbi:methylenetetrahydrofolate reductase [Paracoccus sp. Z330]|uniref:Methylenetetrahydrofolate reductase n=1 Tax=Paracoccus onchidii TaxID=3017813 RepID=A0ABT4ZGL5_9RHOB|nr:methylenetetrahydrofolate reductase [Paracoccus onchidii]MDB6178509.1 methylenetetrahydrofolate reductase [Paracoccus onchidii]
MRFRTPSTNNAAMARFLDDASIEVMPRTLQKVDDFPAHMQQGALVFVAHIDGTPIADMHSAVARLAAQGYRAIPHLPARLVPDAMSLREWVSGYRDCGAAGILVLGGGLPQPRGPYADSMQLLGTGLLDGFPSLFIAGHPEGNRDIDPGGGEAEVLRALKWKADFAERSDAAFQIVTQFAFEADPVIQWARRLHDQGITMPIRIGVAGPAKLQTMLKFAIMCGVGPSLRVLQRRARDVTKLLVPYEPTEFVTALALARNSDPDFPISAAHLFPLGGIAASTGWLDRARAE